MPTDILNDCWTPSLGAWPCANGTAFRVWAPNARRVDIVVVGHSREYALQRSDDDFFVGQIPGVRPGDRYLYRLDGDKPYPDPASRFQPEGVHGPSEIVDPSQFRWTDSAWRGTAIDDLIIYEIHVGTFTPEGTFAAAIEKLPYLVDLGVTAVELMPVAQCPGRWNWGYDGVDLFAPSHAYGRPDDMRRLVDEAHRLGLAALLDVVYNHLGPDGNYLGVYSPHYVSKKHHTDWGDAHNFDGERSGPVREFFIENAVHWVREYHIDGLRLDATHIILDDGPRHFLAELAERIRSAAPERRVLAIAEDHRNWAHMYRPADRGGWGLDAVWADGFHHQVRRFLTGDCEGHYRDYTGSAADIATTMRKGWFYCGQHSIHFDGPHGTEPEGVEYPQFIVSLQNHDQTGNRAMGDRLNHAIEPGAYRAAAALLLCGPLTPLLFMGQEWAASSPFRFFTDHREELGRLVAEGRRREFRHFAAFRDPAARDAIPDPQAEATFLASKLDWDELSRPTHIEIFRLYKAILRLRRDEPALRSRNRTGVTVDALDDATIQICRTGASPPLIVVIRLRGEGEVELRLPANLERYGWEVALSTEDKAYGGSPGKTPRIADSAGTRNGVESSTCRIGTDAAFAPKIRFFGPAAVVLKGDSQTAVRAVRGSVARMDE